VQVKPEAVEQIRNLYAPRDHDVFQLVPKDFAVLASQFYAQMGSPAVTRTNAWTVYLGLLTAFEHLDNLHRIPSEIDTEWGYALTMARDDYREDELELLPNLKDLAQGREGYIYYGGVNNGLGIGKCSSRGSF
ncbi:hypothetical protein C8F01DRAFT_997387, partial [Mycena amicta]